MYVFGAPFGGLRPLTSGQILSNTIPKIVGYSSGCTIKPINEGADRNAPPKFSRLSKLGPVFIQGYTAQCVRMYEDNSKPLIGAPKKVVLAWAGVPLPGLRQNEVSPGRPSPDTPVWVSCSCKYFRYVCEWALSRYGSSDIIYSTGDPARVTNPSGIGMGCKHIYAALHHSISNWSQSPVEDTSLEEPAVSPIPQIPEVEEPEANTEDQEAQEDSDTEEDDNDGYPREASHFSRSLSQRLRSIAYLLDEEDCC